MIQNNVIMICSDCIEERKTKIQQNIDEKLAELFKAGSFYAKARFEEGDYKENMWIKVTELDMETRKIIGNLNNEPQFITFAKLDDRITLDFDEINDLLG